MAHIKGLLAGGWSQTLTVAALAGGPTVFFINRDLNNLKTELKQDIRGVKQDMRDHNTGLLERIEGLESELQEEMTSQIKGLRNDIRDDLQHLLDKHMRCCCSI